MRSGTLACEEISQASCKLDTFSKRHDWNDSNPEALSVANQMLGTKIPGFKHWLLDLLVFILAALPPRYQRASDQNPRHAPCGLAYQQHHRRIWR